MISSISSGSDAMTMMRSSTQKPSQGKDVFQISDSDGNGVVSDSELTALTDTISESTGIDVDDALSYDADGDGGLSGEELLDMLSSNGFSVPQMADGEEGMAQGGPPPPPPPSSEEAISAYSQNSGSDDLMSQLLDALGSDEDASTSYSLFSTTS
jgi:hypothetical protein